MGSPRVLRWFRFLVGGGINTSVTYLIYLALNIVLNYQAAYLTAYAVGFVFSYWFNSRVVFSVSLSWKNFLTYPVVHVTNYLMSALILVVLVEYARMSELLAPIAAVILLVPYSYATSKFVLERAVDRHADGVKGLSTDDGH